MRTSAFYLCVAVTLLVAWNSSSNASELFSLSHLGLPGAESTSIYALEMSADGSTIVGYSEAAGDKEAWRWTAETGVVALQDQLGDPSTTSWVSGNVVSPDGSVISGNRTLNGVREGFIWTEETGIVGLGGVPDALYTSAADNSADGSIVSGSATLKTARPWAIATRWTEATGWVSLGTTEGAAGTKAGEISADGSVFRGRSWLPPADPNDPSINQFWIWTEDTGFEVLGEGIANDMTSDGSVIVGFTPYPYRPFRWTRETGVDILPYDGNAHVISDDGHLVFGDTLGVDGPLWINFATVYDDENGVRDLRDVLISEFGLASELDGWWLQGVADISEDNRRIIGRRLPEGTSPETEWFDLLEPWMAILDPALQAGDADQDYDFDQLDLVKVLAAGKYLTGEPVTWGEGDWDGAPALFSAKPPEGNGVFDQLDIVAAQQAALYLKGPYDASNADQQTSVSLGYNAETGELWVDTPAGGEMSAINIDSASGVLTGEPAQNLDGQFDSDSDTKIFKTTFGESFGSVSFGKVAQTGLTQEFLESDLTVVGAFVGGGGLGDVELIIEGVPEPMSFLLLMTGILGLLIFRRQN